MSQGSRPDRVADQIRSELALLLTREVHDPGIGFVTITRVQMTPDLQQARVFYTALGDSPESWNNETFLQMLAGAVQWTAGRAVRRMPPAPGRNSLHGR